MAEHIAELIGSRFHLPKERVQAIIQHTLMVLAGVSFVLVATFAVAFDSIFARFSAIESLQIGDVAPRDIVAPPNPQPYISAVLTQQAQEAARNSVQPIYDPPDPNVARQQTRLAQTILDYIENVRSDPYGTPQQHLQDLQAITVITFPTEEVLQSILQLSPDVWNEIENEVQRLLADVMRAEIQPPQLRRVRDRLNNQVSGRFLQRQSDIIVALVRDLVQPNTFENADATEEERQRAVAEVEPMTRQFIGGQIIIGENEPIDESAYEALQQLGLLRDNERDEFVILQAILATTLTMVLMSLYMAQFAPAYFFRQTRMLTLLASLFLIVLLATRFLGVDTGRLYVFPTAALAMIYVAIANTHVAIISTLGLAFLTALMASDPMEAWTLVIFSGVIGTLFLQRADRLNGFFVSGFAVGFTNMTIILIFGLAGNQTEEFTFAWDMLLALMSGVVVAPAATIATLYIVTQLFNLPTLIKLIDLSQPSKPLLQRLLREAPGTYQHSLQVANLAEQAANSIGADAQLTHVAALYHDIGKMLNPLYFTENQQDIGNPHDTLNDPYRSADIIISHATEGDEMARQYGLPNRIRDFIREHHGTTQVFVFYQRALQAVDGNESAVDVNDFSYPGPKPQSKETAILMLADSCEAAVRSVKPGSKGEISALVGKIIDDRRRIGQLDESGLTLNDLKAIQTTFVDILQSMFHPRINYKDAVSNKQATPTPATVPSPPTPRTTQAVPAEDSRAMPEPASNGAMTSPTTAAKPADEAADNGYKAPPPAKKTTTVPLVTDEPEMEEMEEAPLSEVPRLPSVDERRSTSTFRKADTDEDESDTDEH